jgi:hypothetical protein
MARAVAGHADTVFAFTWVAEAVRLRRHENPTRHRREAMSMTDPRTERIWLADNARRPRRRRTGRLIGSLIVLAVVLAAAYYLVVRPELQKRAAADSLNDRPNAGAVKADATRKAVLSGTAIRLLDGDSQSPLAHTTTKEIYFDGANGASVIVKSPRPYDDCQNVAYSTDPWLDWDQVWANTTLCVKWEHSGRRHLTALTVDSTAGSTARVEVTDWSWQS